MQNTIINHVTVERNGVRWFITAEIGFDKSFKLPHRETENEAKIDFDFLGPWSTSRPNDRPDRPKTAKNSLYRRMPIGKLFEYYQYLASFSVTIWVFDHPGWPYLGVPPLFCNSFWRNNIMPCPECIFVVTLRYQMVQIGKLSAYYQYLGHFW